MKSVPRGMKKLDMNKPQVNEKPYVHDERPTIYFDSKQLPQIVDWKAGKSYDLNVKVTMISHKVISEQGKSETRAEFRITHVGVDADAGDEK